MLMGALLQCHTTLKASSHLHKQLPFFIAAIKKCPAASAEGHYFGPRALRGSDPVFPDLLAGDFQMGFASFLDEVDQGVQSLAHNRPFRKTTERDALPLRVGDGCISINQPWVNPLSVNPRSKYKPQSFFVHPLRGTQRQTASWPPMPGGVGMPEKGKVEMGAPICVHARQVKGWGGLG
jgi:hypothetical protein